VVENTHRTSIAPLAPVEWVAPQMAPPRPTK
jgi:hypothetical protein